MVTRYTLRRRPRKRRLSGQAGTLFGIGLVIWGIVGWMQWMWVEARLTHASQTTTAGIIDLYQQQVAEDEAWSANPSPIYHYYVTFRFRPTRMDGTSQDTVQTQAISAADYRRLTVGTSVPVRYLPFRPYFATIDGYWYGAQHARHLGIAAVGAAVLFMSTVIGIGKAERQYAWTD
jgi:hypothetical protein